MEDKNKKLNGQLIIALSRSLQIIHRESEVLFSKQQITMAQFTVLEALYHKGDLTIGQLIEKVLSTSGNMTVVIRNLEKQQLIKRIENPNDKRSYIIQLTTKGKTMIQNLYQQHMDFVGLALEKVSKKDKEKVIDILKQLQIKEIK